MAAVIEEKNLGMREFISAGFLFFGAFFLIALATFNQEDGGWTHSGLSSVPKNAGGMIGAWVSDLAFSLFGFEAYLFPLVILWHGYLFYKQGQRHDRFLTIAFRWLGLFITFVAGTVIFYLHVPRLMIDLPNGSGGILGQEAGDALLLMLTESNTTALSLSIFMLGLSFFAGFSWFTLIDKIGSGSIWLLTSTARLFSIGQKTSSQQTGIAAEPKKKILLNPR